MTSEWSVNFFKQNVFDYITFFLGMQGLHESVLAAVSPTSDNWSVSVAELSESSSSQASDDSSSDMSSNTIKLSSLSHSEASRALKGGLLSELEFWFVSQMPGAEWMSGMSIVRTSGGGGCP